MGFVGKFCWILFGKKGIVSPICLFHTCLAVSSYYILHFADIHARPCQIEDHLRWINGNTSQISDEQDLFHCPQSEDPPQFTDCCYSDSHAVPDTGMCCERKSHDFDLGFDDR